MKRIDADAFSQQRRPPRLEERAKRNTGAVRHKPTVNEEREQRMISANENITRIRKEKGMSQQELADKIGVSQTAVTYWETGKRRLKLETIIEVSKALTCDVRDILSGDTKIPCLYTIDEVFSRIKDRVRELDNLESERDSVMDYIRAFGASERRKELEELLAYFGKSGAD